jgi:hypothetical protein
MRQIKQIPIGEMFMKLCNVLVACVVCGLLMGCEEEVKESKTTKNLDVELVNAINNVQVENAIITQHTLYPYHFVTDGEKLNDLGQKDFAVLAKHFTEHPGILNIRRGRTGTELYEARVAYVMSKLKEAGVETNRMSVSDGMPGGSGMPAERVVTIVQREIAVTRPSLSTGTGMSGIVSQ